MLASRISEWKGFMHMSEGNFIAVATVGQIEEKFFCFGMMERTVICRFRDEHCRENLCSHALAN
jgi:hypothetical protein